MGKLCPSIPNFKTKLPCFLDRSLDSLPGGGLPEVGVGGGGAVHGPYSGAVRSRRRGADLSVGTGHISDSGAHLLGVSPALLLLLCPAVTLHLSGALTQGQTTITLNMKIQPKGLISRSIKIFQKT